MSPVAKPPQPPPDLPSLLNESAASLRAAFCAMLQDEIDVLASSVIALDALRRDLAGHEAAARVSGISDSINVLRAEKAQLALRLGCGPLANALG